MLFKQHIANCCLNGSPDKGRIWADNLKAMLTIFWPYKKESCVFFSNPAGLEMKCASIASLIPGLLKFKPFFY